MIKKFWGAIETAAGTMTATAGEVCPKLGAEGAFQQKIDTLPGYVFGPGHGSLTYHLQANACAGGDEHASYRARIITKEIKRCSAVNCPQSPYYLDVQRLSLSR